ncbi:MAG: hypothetical protein EXR77_02370 [Myxococcales bacterium]|nr:hypothetical protein [Myxococcales bacterium]
MKTSRAIFGLLTVVAVVIGCVTAGPRRWYSTTCTGSDICDGTGLCIDGLCARSCTTSVDCGGGICVQKHCLSPALTCKSDFCVDANTCTVDLCNVADGICSHQPSNGACDDGDPCTIGDECIDQGATAVCKAAAKCDDGDPATADSCAKPAAVCSHAANPP